MPVNRSAESAGACRGGEAMRRRDLLTLACTVALGGTAATGRRASAQQKSVLKASDVHPEGYPTVQAVENMGKKLEAATGGRPTTPTHASGHMGGDRGGD